MDNWIDLSLPVATTLKAHPEVKELLIDLGFKPLGAVTSLEMGASLIGLDLQVLIQELHHNGYLVKGVDDHDQ